MDATNEMPFYKRYLLRIPQRHIVAIMSFLAILNVAMINNCLPLTITQMVSPLKLNETIYTIGDDAKTDQLDLSCPRPAVERQFNSSTELKRSVVERYEWSEEVQGLILGSFYIGYVLMHLPGAVLAERFGGKFVIIVGLGCTAILTIATPVAIAVAEAWALMAIRIVIGLCQGAMWPALSTIMASWVPITERGSLGSLVFSGISCGNIVGNFAAGFLLDYYRNWHVVFYTFGITGVIVAVAYFFLCTSNPSTHPFITDKEKAYLQQEIGQLERDPNASSPPWRAIFSSVPVIALIVDMCFSNCVYFIVMNDIPKYMNDILHVSVKENGIYSSVPWAVRLLVAFITGFWADSLIKNKRLSVTNTRKLFVIIAAIFDGTFILAAGFGGCNPMLIGFFFIVSVGSRGFLTSSSLMNSMDLSPNFAGTLTALSNGIGSTTGIFVPLVVGLLTPNSLQSEWRVVFCITASIHLLKAISFTLFGSGEVQPWNTIKQSPEQEARELNQLYDKQPNKEIIPKE